MQQKHNASHTVSNAARMEEMVTWVSTAVMKRTSTKSRRRRVASAALYFGGINGASSPLRRDIVSSSSSGFVHGEQIIRFPNVVLKLTEEGLPTFLLEYHHSQYDVAY